MAERMRALERKRILEGEMAGWIGVRLDAMEIERIGDGWDVKAKVLMRDECIVVVE